jgi:hypothetical protein
LHSEIRNTILCLTLAFTIFYSSKRVYNSLSMNYKIGILIGFLLILMSIFYNVYSIIDTQKILDKVPDIKKWLFLNYLLFFIQLFFILNRINFYYNKFSKY